jgi:hypothetical protein
MNFFKKSIYFFIFLASYCIHAQTVKVIDNKGTLKEVDNSKWSTSGSNISNKNSGNVGIGTASPANTLEIKQGTAGNSGLRFTNLTSSSTATTSSSKVLGVNNNGDVILTNVPGTQNIVDFSTATPTTSGVVFTPNTPADESVVYQSAIDNSLWTYNGTTYVTYTAPASTAWNLANTINDAGSNKTSGIFRTGNVGIGTNNPTAPLEVQSTLVNAYVVAAKFLAPNNTTAGNASQLNFGVSATTGNSADWRYVYQGNGAANNRVDFGMSGYAAPMLSYLNSGNVGIGTSAPLTKLVVNDNAYIASLPISSANLMNNTTFRPLTRFQTTSGANNNAISHYLTTTAAATQAHNYSTGASLPYILQPGGGNVGIGTTNPVNNLDVVGGFNLRNTVGAGGSNYGIEFNTNSNAPRIDWVFNGGYIGQFSSDANNFILHNSKLSTGGFRFVTNPGSGALDRLNILNNGNIGIGTAAPANKLEITQGTAGNSGLRFTNLNSASTATTSSSKVLGLNSTGDVILTNVPGTQNIVDFSTATPTTSGVVFTPNTPADESVVYQSAVDNSMWTYNGTAYVTYAAPASTAWFTAGTTNDAGNSKTSNIYRTGNVGIGATAPAARLHIQGIQATLGANANAPMLRMSRPTWSGFKWGSAAQFNLGTYDDGVNPVNSKSRLDLVLANVDEALSTTPTMTWLANGNVGINNTAPSAPLVVQGVTGTGSLKLIAPSVASGDNWWIGFGHGTTSTDANDRARIGAEIVSGGSGRLFFTTGASGSQTRAMFIDESQRVGIGTSAPVSRLETIQSSLFSDNETATHGFLVASGKTNTDFAFYMGADKTNGAAYMQALKWGVNYAPIALNTRGGNVGVGIVNPLNKFVVKGINGSVSALGTAQTNAIFRVEGETNHALDMGTLTASPYGSYIQSHNKGSAVSLPLNLNPVGGNVGIGTLNPISKLEVNGSATNTAAHNNGGANGIAFSLSNLAYTSLSPGSFNLTGMKDGGTYTLAVQGTTSGTAVFSGSNPSGTAFVFKSINNGPTIAGKQTLYTFIVMGTTVYYYMAAGF